MDKKEQRRKEEEERRKAIEQYTPVINDPDAARDDKAAAYKSRGDTYRRQGNYDAAIADFGQALALYTADDDKAKAYGCRGIAYYEQANYDAALADYRRAIALHTDNDDKAKAYRNRGDAYRRQGNYDAAIQDYTQAIALSTEDYKKTLLYILRGHAYEQQAKEGDAIANYKAARADYKQAIAKAKDNNIKAWAYMAKGHAYAMRAKYGNAIANYKAALVDYGKAIALHTDDNNKALAHRSRGDVYVQQKDYDAAIEDFKKAIVLAKDKDIKAGAYVRCGEAYFIQGDYDAAIANYKEAKDKAKDNNIKAWAYVGRGEMYFIQEDYDAALADFKEALKLSTDNDAKAWAYMAKGHAYAIQTKDDAAIQDFGQIVDDLNNALQHGIESKAIARCKEAWPTEDKPSIARHIFSVFEGVATILQALKIQKTTKAKQGDKKDAGYLSHTTRLSVLRQLLPMPKDEGEPTLAPFRLHHIAYANDPTEGRHLFDELGIKPEEYRQTTPYVMIASFCGARSVDKLDALPIWKTYGDDAQGISLLFNINDIASDEQRLGAWAGNDLDDNKFRAFERMRSDEGKGSPASTTKKQAQDDKSPPQILYRVHYTSNETNKTDQNGLSKKSTPKVDHINKDKKDIEVEGSINNIKAALKDIKGIVEQAEEARLKEIKGNGEQAGNNETKKPSKQEGKDETDRREIYNKTLELLGGVRYLIKNKSYQYEAEYRLVCFVNKENIPEFLKYDQHEPENKNKPRVYVDSDILPYLYQVLTGAKVAPATKVEIQYLLDAHKQINKLEDPAILQSKIPYR